MLRARGGLTDGQAIYCHQCRVELGSRVTEVASALARAASAVRARSSAACILTKICGVFNVFGCSCRSRDCSGGSRLMRQLLLLQWSSSKQQLLLLILEQRRLLLHSLTQYLTFGCNSSRASEHPRALWPCPALLPLHAAARPRAHP